MLTVEIPGAEKLAVKNIVLDFNGTIALDGLLLPGVEERLNALSGLARVYILTADTFGTCKNACSPVKCKVVILGGSPGAEEKLNIIKKLGAKETAAFGNGVNDRLMLAEAALGVLVLGPEGASAKTFAAADIVVTDINDGLDLLLKPKRMAATMRP